MSTWRTTVEHMPNVVKYLLVFGVVVFITFLFPDSLQFRYEFEKGQAWRYDDLRAPFDFAIRKPAEAVEAERKKLTDNFSPYYQADPTVAREAKKQLGQVFNEQMEAVRQENQFKDVLARPQSYLDFGKHFLDNLYQRGILQLAPQHQGQSDGFVIYVVRGNTAQPQTVDNLLDVEKARELLSDSLPYSRLSEPEFLYPILEKLIAPNLLYNDSLSHKILEEELSQIATFEGKVSRGELIVMKGSMITDEVYQKLVSYREQYQEEVSVDHSKWGVLAGYFILASLIIGVFLLYVKLFAQPVFSRFNKLIFILLWISVFSYLVHAVEQVPLLSAYMIPFCIVTILIKTFYNDRLALFTHIVVVLVASFMTSLGYEFTFLQLLAGIVVVLSNIDTRDWSRFFYSIFYIFLAYGLGYLGLSLIREGDFQAIDLQVFAWLFLSTFLTLLAYPLIPLMERFFGFTSAITLVELSDLNKPLLRELSRKAPGTMQHSLQVANLSEEAARKIGADALLVKTAALYHDIGKIANPGYFIENQSGAIPHEELSDLESARLIINHVPEGVKMAKKAGLPNLLIDFIRSHHGTTRAEFFYRSYAKEHPDDEPDDSEFRYPGPRPRTKEETILMMADSIEAACKSLKNPTESDISNLVDKIVAGKITQGQFENSRITFRELEDCKLIFKQLLKSVYHVRIEYPEEKEAE
ncbi:MAG: HDIG domain-containing protein [Phaeodactylibacter sp.]|nr:HDIG domain-containing protein [Phaeodactylibacter sp.]MCB9274740.1 HDIG domain-containing protein [Lewinellaceae bacterium]